MSCHNALDNGKSASGLALLRVSFKFGVEQTTPTLNILESNINLGAHSGNVTSMRFCGFARVHEAGLGVGTDHLQVLIYKDQTRVTFLDLDSRKTSQVSNID